METPKNDQVPQQPANDHFLVKSPPSQKPPIGNGFGGKNYQELMKALQQMMVLQSQQLQILQQLQVTHPMTLQPHLAVMQPRIHQL